MTKRILITIFFFLSCFNIISAQDKKGYSPFGDRTYKEVNINFDATRITIDSIFLTNLTKWLFDYYGYSKNFESDIIITFFDFIDDTHCKIQLTNDGPPEEGTYYIGFCRVNKINFWVPKNIPQNIMIQEHEKHTINDKRTDVYINGEFDPGDLMVLHFEYNIKTKKIKPI